MRSNSLPFSPKPTQESLNRFMNVPFGTLRIFPHPSIAQDVLNRDFLNGDKIEFEGFYQHF